MRPEEIKYPQHPWLPPVFFENWRTFDRTQLRQYSGMHVAWTMEYDRILDSAATEQELRQNLTQAEINPHHVFYEFVEDYTI